MQAILRGKHQRFYSWLQDIKSRLTGTDNSMNELETEMLDLYQKYLQKVEEVREVVAQYEAKQKSIKNRVKAYKKFDLKINGETVLLKGPQDVATDVLID